MAQTSAPPLRKALKRTAPGTKVERELWAAGHSVVVGVDEVGRGAWAGPLTIGAVVIPKDRRVNKIRDSKMLTEREREALFDRITDWCDNWAVGHATARECDELGMSEAQRLAARRAIDGLGVPVDQVLVDGKWDFVGGGRTRTIVKGDASCLSIAAASILAKVTRDRIMRAEDDQFPAYDFAWNKGYPCPRHQQALRGLGPCSIHRLSWSWMDDIPWTGARRYVRPDPQGSLFTI
ncbi:MAG: ribonuclease HII [Acidimicrobiales bacterium]|nr:ribonuclease HII [Acidimicrobiales bacterium]